MLHSMAHCGHSFNLTSQVCPPTPPTPALAACVMDSDPVGTSAERGFLKPLALFLPTCYWCLCFQILGIFTEVFSSVVSSSHCYGHQFWEQRVIARPAGVLPYKCSGVTLGKCKLSNFYLFLYLLFPQPWGPVAHQVRPHFSIPPTSKNQRQGLAFHDCSVENVHFKVPGLPPPRSAWA